MKDLPYGSVLRSFKFAGNGIRLLITREHNAWIHCFAAVCVTLQDANWTSSTEWIAIVFAIGSVLAAEAVNSSIEALADLVSPRIQRSYQAYKGFGSWCRIDSGYQRSHCRINNIHS